MLKDPIHLCVQQRSCDVYVGQAGVGLRDLPHWEDRRSTPVLSAEPWSPAKSLVTGKRGGTEERQVVKSHRDTDTFKLPRLE